MLQSNSKARVLETANGQDRRGGEVDTCIPRHTFANERRATGSERDQDGKKVTCGIEGIAKNESECFSWELQKAVSSLPEHEQKGIPHAARSRIVNELSWIYASGFTATIQQIVEAVHDAGDPQCCCSIVGGQVAE